MNKSLQSIKNVFFKKSKKILKNLSHKKYNKYFIKIVKIYKILTYIKLYLLINKLKNEPKSLIFGLATSYLSKIFYLKYSVIYWILNKFFFYLTKSKFSLNWFLGIYLFKFKFIFLLLLYFYKKMYFMFIEWYNILIKRNRLVKKKWEQQFFFYWNLIFIVNSFHKHLDKEKKIDLILLNYQDKKYYADLIVDFLIQKYEPKVIFCSSSFKRKNNSHKSKLFTANTIFNSLYYYHLFINKNYFLVQHIFFKNYMKFVYDKFISFFSINSFLHLSCVKLKRVATIVFKNLKKKYRYIYNTFIIKKDINFSCFYKNNVYRNTIFISKFLLDYKKNFFKNLKISEIYLNRLFIDNLYTANISSKLLFNLPLKKEKHNINVNTYINNNFYLSENDYLGVSGNKIKITF